MTINCSGQLIDLTIPRVMGILNITPDSFYSGSRVKSDRDLLKRAEKMLKDGATFLDLGAYSSRPGAIDISEDEELKRILPAVRSILNSFPDAKLSIDTFRARVAKECIEANASMVNDISGGKLDPQMFQTIARYQVPFCIMHMKGRPQDMTSHAVYTNLIPEIKHYLAERIAKAREFGIADLIIDPGFGFAKTIAHNFQLLGELYHLSSFDLPVLVGLSRKSMIYKTLGISPEDSLNGTTALHMAALLQGVHILRVHDVREAMECIALRQQII